MLDPVRNVEFLLLARTLSTTMMAARPSSRVAFEPMRSRAARDRAADLPRGEGSAADGVYEPWLAPAGSPATTCSAAPDSPTTALPGGCSPTIRSPAPRA